MRYPLIDPRESYRKPDDRAVYVFSQYFYELERITQKLMTSLNNLDLPEDSYELIRDSEFLPPIVDLWEYFDKNDSAKVVREIRKSGGL